MGFAGTVLSAQCSK